MANVTAGFTNTATVVTAQGVTDLDSATVTQAEVDTGGSLTNTVTADSVESAPDTDTLIIPVTQTPGVNIAKSPGTQSVASGGTANFTLTVTNTGNVTLTGVNVTDVQCTTGPIRTGGDTNSDDKLQTTETWIFPALWPMLRQVSPTRPPS